MKILFLGASGSGKSTQGQILAEEKGFVWLSSGQMFRESGDPEILEILKGAQLVPDELTGKMMIEAIENQGRDNFILDGFPRNLRQCEILTENGIELDKIVEIGVPKEELVKRVALRGREQDKEEILLERVEMYEKTRDLIVDYFVKRGADFVKVDGVGEIEEVAKRVKEVF